MFLLLTLCLWFGQSQQSPAESQTPRKAQQQAAQGESSGVPKHDAGPADKKSQDNQSYASKWFEPMVLLTILLVLGVFITAAIYYKQLQKMEETVRNAEYAQRAWVGIVKGRAVDKGFQLTVENWGNTPAMDAEMVMVIDAGHVPPKLPDTTDLAPVAVGLLGPHATYEVTVPIGREFTAEERGRFYVPSDKFYVWIVGVIFYRDIFTQGLAEGRTTNFCLYLDTDEDTGKGIARTAPKNWVFRPQMGSGNRIT